MVKSVDAGAATITITLPGSGGRDPVTAKEPEDKTYSLAKDVEVAVGAGVGVGVGRASGLFKEAKLADLTAGVRVALSLSADQKHVESILAEGPVVRGKI